MRKKIAAYLLDISKLVFAGVVLGAVLDIEGLPRLAVFLAGVYATIFLAVVAFRLMRDK